jgi:hypothetical protein
MDAIGGRDVAVAGDPVHIHVLDLVELPQTRLLLQQESIS